ncbi:uncharacterized protein EAF01_005648 [Botrytis porri]|uniref:Uncharacterized protein n=1 Tax=Botrytis porri TaxID=87229 RepID=A0A4Z1L5C7_9HELO|nr:uncharacterized protein EAF01_005648 [Botrytis porri]KAF7905127.1 hypothetical protein EAF01_005648 [Botrytis porri]TGO91897.1 hypothetical protein BPOR_0015g00070 [Botrytis porri]
MDTPSTPTAASTSATKPITPSQIPLPSTPTVISTPTPKPATDIPLPETPIPDPKSSIAIENLKLAVKIPLLETSTAVAAATSERRMDDGCVIFSGVSDEVSSNLTSHNPGKPPNKPTPSILQHYTPTPEISPLKLDPASSCSQSQTQSPPSNSSTSLIPRAGTLDLDEIPLLAKTKGEDE